MTVEYEVSSFPDTVNFILAKPTKSEVGLKRTVCPSSKTEAEPLIHPLIVNVGGTLLNPPKNLIKS